MPILTCDHSRRRWMHRLLAAGIVGTALGGGRQVALAMAPADSSVHRRKGMVLVNGMPAETGTPVAAGDTVSTGPDGEAVFNLGDDGFLLRPDSQVTIFDHDRMRELTLERGGVLGVFGAKTITLTTPLASIGIRGTAAYLESHPGSTNVCVCYGHAVMTPKGASARSEEVRNRHHETPRVIRSGPHGPVMEELRRSDHSDEELIMLEALFGRLPPFVPR